jgi:hypothetical protein
LPTVDVRRNGSSLYFVGEARHESKSSVTYRRSIRQGKTWKIALRRNARTHHRQLSRRGYESPIRHDLIKIGCGLANCHG